MGHYDANGDYRIQLIVDIAVVDDEMSSSDVAAAIFSELSNCDEDDKWILKDVRQAVI